MGAPGASTFDLAALGRGPYGTFAWGESRPVLNRLLFAMVRALDPTPMWLELMPRRAEGDERGPVELGWIAPDHLFIAEDPSAARPQDAVANMALLNIVRSDEPAKTIARVADFIRLPPIAQEVIERLGGGESPRALAIANSDQVRGLYPTTVEGVRPIITSFLNAQMWPIFASRGPPGPGRMAFDFVLEIRAVDLAHWREGTLVPEKAPPGSGVKVGVPVPLGEIRGLADAFTSAPGRK
jgi:hypothetical protein